MNVADPRAAIATLLAERLPRYKSAADLAVDTTFLPHANVVKAIIAEFRRRRKKAMSGREGESASG